jgi:NTE family protein
MKKKVSTLIFSGGGVKGLSYIGFLKKFEELSKSGDIEANVQTVAGVSCGALVATMYAIGYTATELEQYFLEKDLEPLRDVRLKYFFTKWGFESGKKIIEMLEELLERKGFDKDITFQALYERTKIDLHIYACNLTRYKMISFRYSDSPNLAVTKAVRMSFGIPFIFTLQKYKGDIIVDGGIMNNYPIDLYDQRDKDDGLDEVLGVKIIAQGECDHHEVDERIERLDSYAYNVMSVVLIHKDKIISMSERYKRHTIHVDTKDITYIVKFNMSKEEKEKLFAYGYEAASKFFEKQFCTDDEPMVTRGQVSI